MPRKKLGKRWQLLTREFKQRARESAPKTPGKGGERLIMHQVAMKLAEMWMRPDVYGREFMEQFAVESGISASRMFRFQDRLIETARRGGMKLNSKRSVKSKAKNPTPKQVQRLHEEIQRRIKEDVAPSKGPDGKRRRKRTGLKTAKRRAVKSASPSHKPVLSRNRKPSKTSARGKANTFRDRTSGYY